MRDRRTDGEGREVRRREALARHREDRLVLHDGDEEVDLAVVALRSRGRASALERLARAKRERERERGTHCRRRRDGEPSRPDRRQEVEHVLGRDVRRPELVHDLVDGPPWAQRVVDEVVLRRKVDERVSCEPRRRERKKKRRTWPAGSQNHLSFSSMSPSENAASHSKNDRRGTHEMSSSCVRRWRRVVRNGVGR